MFDDEAVPRSSVRRSARQLRPLLYPTSSTACCSEAQAPKTFTVTHPFHPLCGQQFVLKNCRHNWGEERVLYFDAAAKLRTMPLSWTDRQPCDQFAEVSSGRSWFRLDDLLELCELLHTLREQNGA